MSLLVTLRQVPYQNTFMHISFYDTVIADPVCACHGQETRCHPQWGRRVPLLPTMETLPPTVTLSTITIHRLMVSRRPSLANNTITEIFKYVLWAHEGDRTTYDQTKHFITKIALQALRQCTFCTILRPGFFEHRGLNSTPFELRSVRGPGEYI